MYAQVLRALARAALDRIEREPWLHVKLLLAEHALDDVRSADALGDRPAPELPSGELTDHALAYGQVKPALAAAARAELETAAPDDLPALVELLRRQERHVDELPVRRAHALHEAPAREPLTDPEVHRRLLDAEAAACGASDAEAIAAVVERLRDERLQLGREG